MEQPENSVESTSAVGTADQARAQAGQMFNELKGKGGLMSFFSFDHFIFPKIARALFIFICALLALGLVVVVIGALAALVQGQILGALGMLVGGVLYVCFFLIFARVWTELVLVGFNMAETLQEIRDLLKQK